MEFINNLLGTPLGFIMWLSYSLTNHYILSLILFTLVIRVAMIPLAIKQQRSSVKMAALKPQMDEIQKKYAGNREKLNQELMAMYQREGYNPASGCLPLLIQLPILIGLFDVVYRPLTHIIRVPQEIIQAGGELVEVAGNMMAGGDSRMLELALFRGVQYDPQRFVGIMGADIVEDILALDMNFLGMTLSDTPVVAFNALIVIPILAGITSFMFSFITMRMNPMQMEGAAGRSMKMMMYIMPLMSVVFTFQFPAGVGLYWSISNVIGIGQSMLMNKLYNPREMAAKAKKEMEERQEKERQERIEAKKQKKSGNNEKDGNDEKGLSQKELNRKRLAEARRREAEKYDEEYDEE